MAKKFQNAVDMYKSKERDRKRRGASISLPKGKVRKTRKKSYRGKATTVSKTKKQKTEPLTGEEWILVVKFLAVMVLFGFMVSLLGFLGGLIATVIIVVLFFFLLKSMNNDNTTMQVPDCEIEEIKRQLDNLEMYQNIANTSDDVYAVQCALDEMLHILDLINNYSEADLNRAGMTKTKFGDSRKLILDNYDKLLEQAAARQSSSEKIIGKNINNKEQLNELPDNQIVYRKEVEQVEKNNVTRGDRNDIYSLAAILQNATKSRNGLYPHELLMLDYASTYKTKNNKFQSFWKYSYYVDEPQTLLDSLYSRGFIGQGDLKETIEHLKVTEIKEELRLLDEKLSGTKSELIERLLAKADMAILEKKYTERYYVLTERGKAELQENPYISYLNKHGYMSIWDMNRQLFQNNPLNLSYRDIIWRTFNEEAMEHFKCRNYGLYRNCRLNMYQFVMEDRHLEQGLWLLCEVALYDLSGLCNGDSVESWKSNLKYCFPYRDSTIKLPPAVIAYFSELQDCLGLKDDGYKEKLVELFAKYTLPRRIFSNEECAEIIINEIGNHPRKVGAVYKTAEERVKQEYVL